MAGGRRVCIYLLDEIVPFLCAYLYFDRLGHEACCDDDAVDLAEAFPCGFGRFGGHGGHFFVVWRNSGRSRGRYREGLDRSCGWA